MHLITSGDRIIGIGFDTVVDADAGLRGSWTGLLKLIVKPEDDPELFLSFAQKAYVKVIALHWRQIKQQWPFTNLERKTVARSRADQNQRTAGIRPCANGQKKNKGDAAVAFQTRTDNFEFPLTRARTYISFFFFCWWFPPRTAAGGARRLWPVRQRPHFPPVKLLRVATGAV